MKHKLFFNMLSLVAIVVTLIGCTRSTTTPTISATQSSTTEPTGVIYYSAEDEKGLRIFRINPDGTGATGLTEPLKQESDHSGVFADYDAEVSKDGLTLAYTRVDWTRAYEGRVIVVDLALEATVYSVEESEKPSLSTEGLLTFGFNGRIYSVFSTSTGNSITLLRADERYNSNPDWSPDGTKIVFESDIPNGGDSRIFVMDADGENVMALTFGDYNDLDPAWSPDGTQIAFRRSNKIYLMNADGTNIHRLTTNDQVEEMFPAWSPDGKWLVFQLGSGNSDRIPAIYIIKNDGFAQRYVTNGYRPTWGK